MRCCSADASGPRSTLWTPGCCERIQIEIAAVQESEVLVEATRHRMLRLGRAEVPLADHAGGVAALLEVVRQHALVERRAETFLGRSGDAAGVELVAEALLVAPGHETGARRTAHRRGDVALGEARSALGDGVDVRRPRGGAAVGADVAVPEVVGEDDDQVRRPLRLGREHRAGEAEAGNE